MGTAIIGLISAVLPTVLKVIGYFIDKKVQEGKWDAEARIAFLNFVDAMENHTGDSARLRKSAKDQKAKLVEMIENANKNTTNKT